MPLPDLTALQFAVLDILHAAELHGRELRAGLSALGIHKSGPAFYQLMSRLEDAKYVRGRYDEKVIDGQRIKERRYRILGKGLTARARTLDFYADSERSRLGRLGVTA